MTINWWTLGIQTVNVVILVWLLQRFFWRPVAAMIAQRRDVVRKTIADADAGRAKATAELAEIDHTRAGFTVEREKLLADAKVEADLAHAASLSDAGRQCDALVAAAKAGIATESADTEKMWRDRAASLAIDIAGKLAKRLDGPAVQAAFLEWLVAAIRSLPAAERAAVGGPLEATTATALDPSEQQRCVALIGQALGAERPISFTVDPALIAGLELRGEHFSVGNSWRADLARIRADIPRAA